MVATLEELDEAALIQILAEPKNALTKQYQKMFGMEGVELEIRDGALRAIAAQGARSARPARAACARFSRTCCSTSCTTCRRRAISRASSSTKRTITNDGKPLLMFADPPKVASAHN